MQLHTLKWSNNVVVECMIWFRCGSKYAQKGHNWWWTARSAPLGIVTEPSRAVQSWAEQNWAGSTWTLFYLMILNQRQNHTDISTNASGSREQWTAARQARSFFFFNLASDPHCLVIYHLDQPQNICPHHLCPLRVWKLFFLSLSRKTAPA